MKIKIGVIFGGETVEHEVSIISAVHAMNYLDTEKYDIIPIYIGKDRNWYTGKMLMEMEVYSDFDNLKKYAKKVTLCRKGNIVYLQSIGFLKSFITDLDIAFPIVHGKGVEDGSLAGFLDILGIPYVGPDILGAAIGQDKVVQKQILENNGILVPKYTWFYDIDYLNDSSLILKNIQKIGYPVIIKPAKLGSSIGITVAKTENDIEKCIEEAIKYDHKIIVEEVIPNLLEVNCSVLGSYEYAEASAIAEMITDNDFLTYEDKYISGDKGKYKLGVKNNNKLTIGQISLPAKISEELEKEIKELSISTFKLLNLNGVARIDFLINKKENKVYVNEPNTIPGLLSCFLWSFIGKDYSKLLDELINLTIRNYKNSKKKVTYFESNILSSYSGSKGLKGKLKF